MRAPLYAGHVPTTIAGKLLLGVDAAARALADPRRARMVGVVGEATGAQALRRMHARMRASMHERTHSPRHVRNMNECTHARLPCCLPCLTV